MPSPNRTERLPAARIRRRERDLVEAAARARGVHLSELVRDATLREAREELEELTEDRSED